MSSASLNAFWSLVEKSGVFAKSIHVADIVASVFGSFKELFNDFRMLGGNVVLLRQICLQII